MDKLQRLLDADQAVSAVVAEAIPEGHRCGIINVTEDQWNAQEAAFKARDDARAALMPTEQDAIKMMAEAFTRLKDLGWREAIYCPKDGSTFDAIEPGSTGIHPTHYSGEWPTGSWWCEGGGDLWPSRPCLYRPSTEELAERERRIEAFRAQAEQLP